MNDEDLEEYEAEANLSALRHDKTPVPVPDDIQRLWPRLSMAAAEIGGWFDDYSGGFQDDPNDGFPIKCPDTIERRYIDDRGDDGTHFQFGTFCVFRVLDAVLARLNEGYEDSMGTENERFVLDDGFTAVVYML